MMAEMEMRNVGGGDLEEDNISVRSFVEDSVKPEGKEKSCFQSFMSCLCGDDDDDGTSDAGISGVGVPLSVDDTYCELCGEKKKCVRLLLLGTGESGKSTFVKQFKILQSDGFSQTELKEKIEDIRLNLRVAIVTIVQALALLPDIELDDPDSLQPHVEYMSNVAALEDFSQPYPKEFYDRAKVLWADGGVKECADYGYMYQLIDCAKYFLDHIDRIRREDYVPTEQDVIWCRIRTTGIVETRYVSDNTTFHIFDVGGQITERKRWIATFYQCTAVIFVADSSCYDTATREEKDRNRMEETLETFEHIWNNRYLRDKSIMLFLNKEDLLISKVASNLSKISDYFNDYDQFDIDQVKGPEFRRLFDKTQAPEVSKAKAYLLNKFKEIYSRSSRGGERSGRKNHICYPHFTKAVDTENVRRVYENCNNIIKNSLLIQYGI